MKTGLKYPFAQVTAYGPNAHVASKLVVSIFKKPGPPCALERWTSEGQDIRQNPAIMAEVNHFIARQHPAETIWNDFIFGCPHEEGIDYPDGEECPRCPFWMNLDRLTMEPKSLERPITAEQILAGLTHDRPTQPLRTLAAAELHRAQLVEPFVQVLERALAQPAEITQDDALLFGYALAFLAAWREPRAFSLIHRWLSLPGESPHLVGGDWATVWGARLLAHTGGGQAVTAIKQLIENPAADDYCRGEAIGALAILAAHGECAPAEVADYFGWLVREGMDRDAVETCDALVNACIAIEAVAVFDDLRQAATAAHELLIDPFTLSDMDAVETEPRGTRLARLRAEQPPFDDVVKETRWFFERNAGWEEDEDDEDLGWEDGDVPPFAPAYEPPYAAPEPYVAPPKVGRNEPCPCGSGKKYKKCCGG